MPEIHCAHDAVIAIGELTPNAKNPNRHPDRQIELLARIIEGNGWRSPITVSTRSGMIVRGHGRYEAAKRLGLDRVPVDYQDYASEAEEWQDLLADNRIAELSHVDEDLLRGILQDIDLNVELAGYEVDYVDDLLARRDAERLANEIVTEEEYADARNTAENIIAALTDKVRMLAEEHPKRLNGAIAVIVQKGRGNHFLFLADPNTADAVAELKRLADAGDHSPIEAFFEQKELAP